MENHTVQEVRKDVVSREDRSTVLSVIAWLRGAAQGDLPPLTRGHVADVLTRLLATLPTNRERKLDLASGKQVSAIYRDGPITAEDYDDVIALLLEAKNQLLPDGRHCCVCGDSDHQAFECHHNPLVLARRAAKMKLAFASARRCGKTFAITEMAIGQAVGGAGKLMESGSRATEQPHPDTVRLDHLIEWDRSLVGYINGDEIEAEGTVESIHFVYEIRSGDSGPEEVRKAIDLDIAAKYPTR
jgi:hypothetical protein